MEVKTCGGRCHRFPGVKKKMKKKISAPRFTRILGLNFATLLNAEHITLCTLFVQSDIYLVMCINRTCCLEHAWDSTTCFTTVKTLLPLFIWTEVSSQAKTEERSSSSQHFLFLGIVHSFQAAVHLQNIVLWFLFLTPPPTASLGSAAWSLTSGLVAFMLCVGFFIPIPIPILNVVLS